MADANAQGQETQTTGHVWDEDLFIRDNPIPAWWTRAFYASLVFAVVYWIYYPSWPIGQHFLPGIARVTHANTDGGRESWHWNARALLLKDSQDAAHVRKSYLDKLNSLPFHKIGEDPDLLKFVMAAGKSLFANHCAACHPMVTSMQRTRMFTENCAACHRSGAARVGAIPRVADDKWIYGGTHDRIQESIAKGRRGYMPPFARALESGQIDDLAHYVLALSGNPHDPAKAVRGDTLYHSHAAACFYCHGDTAQGRQDIGAANLTDDMWLWAGVPVRPDMAGKVAAVKQIIQNGLNRGVMPAWERRLTPGEIKVLTVYVHKLGGGK